MTGLLKAADHSREPIGFDSGFTAARIVENTAGGSPPRPDKRTSSRHADIPDTAPRRVLHASCPAPSSLSRSCCPACARIYTATHFRLATDTRELFPRDLPWVERAWHYIDRFPEQGILVVVDAPTPELVDQASARLAAALETDHEHFRSIDALQGDPFFARNALLYLPKADVEQIAGRMGQAAPLIQALSADPSLRGALTGLDFGLLGAANGFVPPDALARPMNMAADTVDDVLAGRPAHFSWRLLAEGKPAEPRDLRRFIQVQPVLDYRRRRAGPCRQRGDPGRGAEARSRRDLSGAGAADRARPDERLAVQRPAGTCGLQRADHASPPCC